MVTVRCRQCGEVTRLPDDHGATTVVCAGCRWRETYPAHRSIPRDLKHEAAAAFKARRHREALAEGVIDDLEKHSPTELDRFCGRLFEAEGYVVTPVDPQRAQTHAFELSDGSVVTYAACKRALTTEAVGCEEVENLIGAMQHGGVDRGVFITTGSFDDACRRPAERAGVELIDRDALRQRLIDRWLDLEDSDRAERDVYRTDDA